MMCMYVTQCSALLVPVPIGKMATGRPGRGNLLMQSFLHFLTPSRPFLRIPPPPANLATNGSVAIRNADATSACVPSRTPPVFLEPKPSVSDLNHAIISKDSSSGFTDHGDHIATMESTLSSPPPLPFRCLFFSG
ncbi:hypothetical protein PV04_05961 [Phialophora macrospora]|uniref:Uncharacterized protein n=1 Tax=Phialophora macrospora TaxID=1851006 RepID=A0A0D2FIQ4_9EURO|nr:hypothetical protein PV04_05961 [Phialophora macrospora]